MRLRSSSCTLSSVRATYVGPEPVYRAPAGVRVRLRALTGARRAHVALRMSSERVGRAVETSSRHAVGAPSGSEVNPRGRGPGAEADAAHGVHACESRDAGRAPPFSF